MVADYITGLFISKFHHTPTPPTLLALVSRPTFLMATEDVYGRPCRACNDFKSFMKNVPTPGGQTVGGEKASVDEPQPQHECPPDRMELGNRSWSLLHSVAAYFPSQPTLQQQEDARNFMHLFSR